MIDLTPVLLQQLLDELLQNAGVFTSESSSNALIIGLSGGVDSVVLLHALSASKFANKGTQLKAVHINHQLQSSADDWQLFCISFCKQLNVPLECIKVDARSLAGGEGPEAAARQARYAAFKQVMDADDVLLTGHHLDDQVETVFLQMLRGTGVDGAAGIAPVSEFNGSYLVRPLLAFSREAIETYANKNHLRWVEDPSNNETHYDRNYLRHNVLPVIEKRWPAYRETLGRFAKNMRQASDILLQIAEQDLAIVISSQEKNVLSIDRLQQLSLARKNNILRYWVSNLGFSMPTATVIKQIHATIQAKIDAVPCVAWGDVELRRFRHKLYLHKKNVQKIESNFSLKINQWPLNEKIEIPHLGFLTLVQAEKYGIKKEYFLSHDIQIKFRKGGEKCKPIGRHKTQSLKKLFQEYNVPPWTRDITPIIFINGEIAAVVNVFYCASFVEETFGENADIKQSSNLALAIRFTPF